MKREKTRESQIKEQFSSVELVFQKKREKESETVENSAEVK